MGSVLNPSDAGIADNAKGWQGVGSARFRLEAFFERNLRRPYACLSTTRSHSFRRRPRGNLCRSDIPTTGARTPGVTLARAEGELRVGFADQVISGATGRLRLLAPPQAVASEAPFRDLRCSSEEHSFLLSQAQKLRGQVYLRDGAVAPSDLDASGRLRSPVDNACWHVLQLGSTGAVTGCARYRAHAAPTSFGDLDAHKASLASDPQWGRSMREAVCYEIRESFRVHKDFFEVGGWAIAESVRFSESAFTIALATYALGRFLGGGRGIATATTRNRSSRMLQRLGGQPLRCGGEELPPYFDHRFGCVMELVAFDTAAPNPKYSDYIASFLEYIPSLPVVFGGEASMGPDAAVAQRLGEWNQAAAEDGRA